MNDISGKYKYEYDLDNRLAQVNFNGNPLRSYSYDAYGNRISIVKNGIITKYSYDELDRLLATENENIKTTYSYDNRGNQTSITENGSITKTFTFDAANMLAKVTDKEKGEATYTYNGFGKRVAVSRPEENIEYLLDLTKDYHNMLVDYTILLMMLLLITLVIFKIVIHLNMMELQMVRKLNINQRKYVIIGITLKKLFGIKHRNMSAH